MVVCQAWRHARFMSVVQVGLHCEWSHTFMVHVNMLLCVDRQRPISFTSYKYNTGMMDLRI